MDNQEIAYYTFLFLSFYVAVRVMLYVVRDLTEKKPVSKQVRELAKQIRDNPDGWTQLERVFVKKRGGLGIETDGILRPIR